MAAGLHDQRLTVGPVGAELAGSRASCPVDPPVIYKLGGSLLDLPGFVDRLRQVLSQRSESPLIVVGGGRTADVVREWDRIHRLGEEAAHWLAIESMRLNESLVTRLLPEAVRVSCREEARRVWRDGRLPVLDAFAFLRAEEDALLDPDAPHERRAASVGSARQLPRSWDVTSDSIAAWIAHRWPAAELVLLKSILRPSGAAISTGDEGGALPVDPHFAEMAAGLNRVGWANLRDAEPVIRDLAGLLNTSPNASS